MSFDLFISETGGSSFWTETHNNVQVENGIFNVILGSVIPLDPNDFTGNPLWLQTTVTGEVMTPRKKIVSSSYSVRALYSDTADYSSNSTSDNDWTITGNVLYPSGQYGIAIFGNILYGDASNTHVNLVKETMKPGYYEFDANIKNYSSGIYFLRMNANDFSSTKKLIITR